MYRSTNGALVSFVSLGTGSVSTYDIAVCAHGEMFAATDAGTFRSSSGGITWSSVQGSSTSVDVAPNDHVFVSTSAGVQRSTDHGSSWSTVLAQYFVQKLFVIDSDLMFAGTYSVLWRTTNGGQNWSDTANGLFNRRIISLAKGIGQSGLFAATTGAGIFRSTDSGLSWSTTNNGLRMTAIRSLNITPANILQVATFGSGVYRSVDGGVSWRHLSEGLPDPWIYSSASDSHVNSFVGTGSGAFRWNDGLSRWERMQDLYSAWVVSFFVSPTDYLLAGTNAGIYKSTTQGTTWQAANVGLPSNAVVYAMTRDRLGNLFAAANIPVEGSRLYSSSNDGGSWTLISANLPTSNPHGIVSVQDSILLLGFEFYGLYRSTNRGQSWAQAGFASTSVWSMLMDSYGRIYVGATTGVHRSSNAGLSWQSISTGLPPGVEPYGHIYCLGLDSLGYLVAGGSGVFRSVQSTITHVQGHAGIPADLFLGQNYPNPFNPATTISFSLASKLFVSLKVFDVLGREVSILVADELTAGTYSQRWNAAGLSSGVYFYRLQAGSFTETKKLVLLR